MKKFLAILLVSIMSLGVLGGTLVGIQSKGFREWGWTETLKSKLEKLKFWEKDEEKGIDRDTEIYNDLVNTSVLATSFNTEVGRTGVSNLTASAWTYEKGLVTYPHFAYDNQDNVTDVGSYQFDVERAKLVLNKNDTNLKVSGKFHITGKRSSELWGKFGFQFVDSNGNGVFYYVNAFGEVGTEVENIKGNKVCIVPIEKYVYNWNKVYTPVVSVEGEEVNNFNNASYIFLSVARNGSDFIFYLNNYPIHTLTTSIESFETIYPELFTMNVDLKVYNLSCYKHLDISLENQTKVYDRTNKTWIYNLEKGVDYNVVGLEEGVNYNTIQSLNGKALNVYKNKVETLEPNTNLDSAELVEFTSANFGENTFNKLANVSSFYNRLYDENNVFVVEGDLEDGKGCFWEDENNDTYYLWRASQQLDVESEVIDTSYITFIFSDTNGNIGMFNFRILD